MEINANLKDSLLDYLLTKPRECDIPWNEPISNIPFDKADMLIDQFVSMGLMQKREPNKHHYTLKLSADAFDFKNDGGFAGMEARKMMELDKLEMELKKLQNTFPDKVKMISGALSAIAAVKGMFI